MTLRDDTVRLRDMLEYSVIAVNLANGRKPGDLDSDIMLRLALIKAVEVIGESAHQLSQFTRDQNPSIPWHELIGTRHRLVHGYHQIDYDILWDIVTLDLPPLTKQLQTILENY